VTLVGESITVEALETDPYPIYKRLRRDEPACWVGAVGLWLVTRWEDVQFVALHPDIFTADVDTSPLTRTLGSNVLTLDGPAQKRIRETMDPALRPGAVKHYAPEIIAPIAQRHLAAIEGRGAAEIMSEFAEPVSVLSLGQLMGLGELPADTLRRWFAGLALGGSNFEGDPAKQEPADRASAEVDEVVGPILEHLERSPDDSILAHMLHGGAPAERLSRAEVMANLKLILLGGMQEPGDAIAIALWALLSHPDALAEVQQPELCDQAVEEALRWYSPVGTQTRQVTRPVVLGGVRLEPGARVAAVLASANRDERHWKEPELFDIHRPRSSHAAFGFGTHHCAGASFARHEVVIPLRLLLHRLPRLRLDPEFAVEHRGWEFRAPVALHVRW
jgi:cytochrome P450